MFPLELLRNNFFQLKLLWAYLCSRMHIHTYICFVLTKIAEDSNVLVSIFLNWNFLYATGPKFLLNREWMAYWYITIYGNLQSMFSQKIRSNFIWFIHAQYSLNLHSFYFCLYSKSMIRVHEKRISNCVLIFCCQNRMTYHAQFCWIW